MELPESSIATNKQDEFLSLVSSMCFDNFEANKWLKQWFQVTMTWDHIVDDDEIDKGMAENAFLAMTLDWPLNPFFEKYKGILVPALCASIHSWKFSNKETSPKWAAFQCYTSVPLTVAFLLGGYARSVEYADRIHTLMWEICQEDDKKDGGKK